MKTKGTIEMSGTETEETFMQKLESILFPLIAALVGIGYTVAIIVNNPIEKVLSSPHALILLAIFISIAFFPLRSVFRALFSEKSKDVTGGG